MKVLCHSAGVSLFGQLYLMPGENEVDETLWSQLKNVEVPTKHGKRSYVDALIECGQLEVLTSTSPVTQPSEPEPDPEPEPKPKKKRGRPRKKKAEA